VFGAGIEEVTKQSEQNRRPAQRGLFLRILYRVYTNYLGVTPPTPAQERIAAVALIGGVIIGIVLVVVLVLFFWRTMMRLGAQ
jgi:hypothetical protein